MAVSFGVGLSLPDRPAFAFQATGIEEEAKASGGLKLFRAIDWQFARLAEVVVKAIGAISGAVAVAGAEGLSLIHI